jgi:hypothetical protein
MPKKIPKINVLFFEKCAKKWHFLGYFLIISSEEKGIYSEEIGIYSEEIAISSEEMWIYSEKMPISSDSFLNKIE